MRPPGFTLTIARDISDNGAIVANSNTGLVLLPRAGGPAAPVVGAIAFSGAASIHVPVSFSASFTDSDPRDTHKAAWSWGDGQVEADTVSESNGAGSVSAMHTYHAAGMYNVRLTVTDSSGRKTVVHRTVMVCGPGAPKPN